MKYWWLVEKSFLDITDFHLPEFGFHFFHTYVPVWLLVISAVLFSAYIARKGVKRLIRAIFLTWFAYTVLFSIVVLLILLKVIPASCEVNPPVMIVNMFTVSAVAAFLAFSTVFGVLELLVDVIPKFLIASGCTGNIPLMSIALTAILAITGFVLVVLS